MDQALEILPADYWRWYLISNAPESDDSSFTLEHFTGVVNKDLSDVLGNFVNRITKFCASKFDLSVPAGADYGDAEHQLTKALETRIKSYTDYLDAMEYRKAAAELRGIWALGNEYLQDTAPWTAFKTDPKIAATSVRMGLNLIRLIAHISAPIIPFTSEKMLAIFDESLDDLFWPEDIAKTLAHLKPDTPFKQPEVLFTKVSDEDLEEWREKFGGQ